MAVSVRFRSLQRTGGQRQGHGQTEGEQESKGMGFHDAAPKKGLCHSDTSSNDPTMEKFRARRKQRALSGSPARADAVVPRGIPARRTRASEAP